MSHSQYEIDLAPQWDFEPISLGIHPNDVSPQVFELKVLVIADSQEGLVIVKNDLEQLCKYYRIPIEVVLLSDPKHLAEIISLLDFQVYCGVCFVTGDGIFHQFLNICTRRGEQAIYELAYAIIPTGGDRSEGLAKSLGVTSALDGVGKMIRALYRKERVPLDLYTVENGSGRVWDFGMTTWGFLADLNYSLASTTSWIPCFRHVLLPLKEIYHFESKRAIIKVDDSAVIDDCFFTVYISNVPFIANNMHVAPQAKPGDGFLHVVIIRHVRWWQALKILFGMARGNHVEYESVTQYRGKKVILQMAEQGRYSTCGISENTSKVIKLETKAPIKMLIS